MRLFFETSLGERILFLLKFFAFWLVIFLCSRVLFLFYNFSLAKEVAEADYLQVFIRGLWMDTSMTGYFALVASLLFGLFFFFCGRTLKFIFDTFTFVLLLFVVPIVLADVELYRNWGFRMDSTPLLYLKTPLEAAASVPTALLLFYLFLCTVLILGVHYLFRRFISRSMVRFYRGNYWLFPMFLFVAAVMIIPIRGGFGIAPMNTGKAFFSTNQFANHSGINVVWNVSRSLLSSKKNGMQYVYMDESKAKETFDKLMVVRTDTTLVLDTIRPNVVIIVIESFTSNLIATLGGEPDVTPNFNSLTKEGLLFSHIYSSGFRSEKGMAAIFSGYPDQPQTSVVKFPEKTQKLPFISKVLKGKGYSTAFYYGGDLNFANMRSYFMNGEFQRLVTVDDFPSEYNESKWGVNDGYLFNRLLSDLKVAKGPIFYGLFTLSSHEPYEVPHKSKFLTNEEVGQFKNSINYTDKCLGDFFREVKKLPIWNSTLFVIVADHGHRLPTNYASFEEGKFRIPMLWLGGALNVKDSVVSKTGSQYDIAATLLKQLKIDKSAFIFSKDILTAANNGFALYTYTDGFGFVTDSSLMVYDNTSNKFIVEKNGDKHTGEKGKALFQTYQKHFSKL